MIEVHTREVDGRSVCGPVIVCDHCNKPIDRADDGLYAHPVTDQPCHAELYFAHRVCIDHVESAKRAGREWVQTDLDLFPLFVADVMHVDLHDLEVKGQKMGEAGLAY